MYNINICYHNCTSYSQGTVCGLSVKPDWREDNLIIIEIIDQGKTIFRQYLINRDRLRREK